MLVMSLINVLKVTTPRQNSQSVLVRTTLVIPFFYKSDGCRRHSFFYVDLAEERSQKKHVGCPTCLIFNQFTIQYTIYHFVNDLRCIYLLENLVELVMIPCYFVLSCILRNLYHQKQVQYLLKVVSL